MADTRVIRLIKKWLHAGVLEDGQITRSELGTVQGGSISPLLANIYLHYAFDLWAQWWRRKRARGDLVVVRFADDFVGQKIQPFWIEDEARQLQNTNFIVGGRFKPHAVRDGNLITGQQQYSGRVAARLAIEALGT